jgi:predicted O-methyltransferase YrrM
MSAKHDLLAQLWRGHDPFANFPRRTYAGDVQGWNYDHPYLTHVIDALRPRLVVEVGVWKGCSVMTMAERLKAVGVDGVVLAVDTWLGSWDHWLVDEFFEELDFHNGYPTLFWRFMANIVDAKLQDYVVPLPLDSLNANEVLHRKGISLDAVHIDAGHDYGAVLRDLEAWWLLIRPGGVLIADDYFDDEKKAWPEVKRAVDDFVAGQDLGLRHERGKAWIVKPDS